jgi:hypothetical protein
VLEEAGELQTNRLKPLEAEAGPGSGERRIRWGRGAQKRARVAGQINLLFRDAY